MKYLIVALVCLAAVSQSNGQYWNSFKATYTVSLDQIESLPRTLGDQLADEWEVVSTDCKNDGKFDGFLHMIPGDISVGLLFDIQGSIAGIQTYFDKETLESQPGNTVDYLGLSPMYQTYTLNGTEYFVLTAYFVEPSTICTTGRNPISLPGGTGTGVYVQNGQSAEVTEEIPWWREDALNSGWTNNHCFATMGHHNFYEVENWDSNQCNKMRPVFGLYNDANDLLGFGFIIPGTIHNQRFEHPTTDVIKLILGDTPSCIEDLSNRVGLTSLHVYFIARPRLIFC